MPHFDLAVPIFKCSEEDSCMIFILNGTFCLRSAGIDFVSVGSAIKLNTIIIIIIILNTKTYFRNIDVQISICIDFDMNFYHTK